MNRTMIPQLGALALAVVLTCAYGPGTSLADEAQVTVWEDGLEVFAEHPPLVAGSRAQIVTYITLLDGYRTRHQGRLSATLRAPDGSAREASVSGAPGKGLYLLGLTPAQPGEHVLELRLELPGQAHRAEVPLSVYADAGGAEHEHEHEEDILFTKAQQALIPFAIEAARLEEIAERLTAPASVEAAAGRRAEVSAPARGLLRSAGDRPWPQAGQRVRRGEPLAMLLPLAGIDDVAGLASEAEAARERLKLAEAQLARVRQLAEEGVVAERRLAEAQAEETAARGAWRAASARLAAARGGGDGDVIALAAPLDGLIVESALAPGQVVEAGARLATVIDDRRVVIRVELLAADAEALADAQALRLRRPGGPEWLQPPARLVHRAAALEAGGVLALRYEMDNDGAWPPGLPLIASLPVGRPSPQVTVPEAAVIDDDGVAVVMVQHGGEAFERRPIRPGLRAAGRVAVLDGLDEGERVVTAGAYAVMLAGRGPAGGDGHHGHSH